MKLYSKKSEKVVLFEKNKADLVQISATCDSAHKTSTKFDLDKKLYNMMFFPINFKPWLENVIIEFPCTRT